MEDVETITAEEPRVLDTYSLSYAFILLFLLPGVALMSRLHFGDDRASTYTFEYVSLVTVPFLLGLVLTFLTDHADGWRRAALRALILTPLVIMTGVTVMFGASMLMIPASKLLGIAGQGLSVAWWGGFAVVSAPLAVSLWRRLRQPLGMRSLVQIGAIALALALIVGLAIFSFGSDANIYELVRKDVVIYVVGALSWYAPSFGLAAGLWRRSGLI